MKILLASALIMIAGFAYSQNPDLVGQKSYSWQVALSYNKMINPYPGIVPRSGFGFSFLRLWREDKHFQTMLGFAYQRNHYFTAYDQTGHFSNYQDIELRMSSFSFPYRMRVAVGKKIQFFAEGGLSLDFTILRGKGTEVTYPPGYPPVERKFDSGFGFSPFLMINWGGGVSVPWKNSRAVIALDFHNNAMEAFGLDTDKSFENYRKYLTLNFGFITHFASLPK